MSINIDIPERKTMIPKITVLGVGGAGGNAINNMINLKLQGINFVAANTDAQALASSQAEHKLQLGENTTKGLGAGSSPEIGAQATEESKDEVLSYLSDSNMVFITAGMGGGTGTGAAPIIAKFCRENGILTVGVVTKPFHFEGSHRMKTAEMGVQEMQNHVDTLIVIPNQNLFHKATEKTTFAEAFNMVDNVLYSGIKGITDLMTMPGLINLDFADIRAIMGGMGKAMMGTGESGGEKRALDAAEAAISNPLLDHTSMKGAKGVLINISGGLDMTLFEADEAAQRVKDEVDPEANIIFGSTFDKDLDGSIRVSVVATGIDIATVPGSNSFFNKVESNYAPAAKNTIETNGISERSESINSTSNDVQNSFIPPEAVDPQNLEASSGAVQNNVVSLADKISQEEQNMDSGSDNNVSQQAVPNSVSLSENSQANKQHSNPMVKESLPNNIQSQGLPLDGANNVENQSGTATDKRGNKIGKSIGGIINFFRDLQHDENNNVKQDTGNEQEMVTSQPATSVAQNTTLPETRSNDSSEDLTLSDDILNVPTFIRNKNEEGGN